MATLEQLLRACQILNAKQIDVLLHLAQCLQADISVTTNPNSNLGGPDFVEALSARLIAYHAMHEEKLTKKAFEFIFAGACRAIGKTAVITVNSVNPGADVIVDGVPFSLKTEGSQAMSKSKITISKLMEARWLRECLTSDDYSREVTARVTRHLSHYQRILILRAFETEDYFEYDLLEVPLFILLNIGNLRPADFSPRTRSGGSSAQVLHAGREAFSLRLDGSVEKITIANLRANLCIHHATWRLSKRNTCPTGA